MPLLLDVDPAEPVGVEPVLEAVDVAVGVRSRRLSVLDRKVVVDAWFALDLVWSTTTEPSATTAARIMAAKVRYTSATPNPRGIQTRVKARDDRVEQERDQ